ncbi:sensor protein PilS [Fluviicoccus keumensis]|uniref:histidine kinase n=1 Tax=Fluviicoccus keumensis TaxID=1435465 RepID=A0A4Q7ZA82_9GAMM|nr:ATP-binding protein [Fluviicoccus keumensis]RZU47477.1 sensor protein PilS [Fluviicoccus keumensis]
MSTRSSFSEGDNDWRLLRVYVYYRLVLSALLVALFAVSPYNPILGGTNPKLYLLAAVCYLGLCTLSLVLTGKLRAEPRFQGFMLTLIDIFAITLIMHASGGPSAQLSVLYLVIVTAGNILLPGKQGTLIAAVATVSVLYEQVYSVLDDAERMSLQTLAQSSLLGLSFFTVAVFSQLISLRFRQMEALAQLRSEEIANLQKLNEQIVERMHTGIMVVSSERRLLLMNNASRQLLGVENVFVGVNLKEISPLLDSGLLAWQLHQMSRPLVFKNQPGYPEMHVSFMSLGQQNPASLTIIFMENTAQTIQKAQQLKLASLGRLTASIAHEVRNPLGAISHAAQLLAESNSITGPDQRLLMIIQQHCVRVNGIIESILQLSRRDKSLPERIRLSEWLAVFIEDMRHIHADIDIQTACDEALEVRFDPQQLYQVTTNLVSNAIHHGLLNQCHTVKIVCGLDHISHLPFMDILDGGLGVLPERQKHLFEPFYTTEKTGTGLGLYISRELCEANQAHLDYIPVDSGGCFRISFSHPDRLI